jgi:hypothetical protein
MQRAVHSKRSKKMLQMQIKPTVFGLAVGALLLFGCQSTIPPEHAAAIEKRQAYIANPGAVLQPELDRLIPQCIRAVSGQGVDPDKMSDFGYYWAKGLLLSSYVRHAPLSTLGVFLQPTPKSCVIKFGGDYLRWPAMGAAAKKTLASIGFQPIGGVKGSDQSRGFKKGNLNIVVDVRAFSGSQGQIMELVFRKQ